MGLLQRWQILCVLKIFLYAAIECQPQSHCALLIPNGNINQISGFRENNVCIPFDAINQAFFQVRQKIVPRNPQGRDWTTIDIGVNGQILVEISKILAQQFKLSLNSVSNALPLIDTSKTAINSICPNFLKPFKCQEVRYRHITALCNNLNNSQWGSTRMTLQRLLSPVYADGVDAPRMSITNQQLPNPRVVSAVMHRDTGNILDHATTILFVGWGQLTDHDMAMAAATEDDNGDEPPCCDRTFQTRHPNCFPIQVPPGDTTIPARCMEFVRSAAGIPPDCKLGVRSQMNQVTSVLDANYIYGLTNEWAASLRTFQGGLLRTTNAFRQQGLKDLLPLKQHRPDEICLRPNPNIFCFQAGDIRANEQIMLTVLQTFMMRQHNRLALQLSQINPRWNDEKVYQESRHIMAAISQHITFNEFLPMLLGKQVMERYGLILLKQGYYDGYDPKINPTLFSSFLTSAFRFGHSLVPTTIERFNKFHQPVGSQRLSSVIRQPFDLYRAGWMDQFMLGFINSAAWALDSALSQEMTNHLFERPGDTFGLDLAAINIQRGRDHGVPGYNAFREFCGIGRARKFDEFSNTLNNDTILRLQELYRHPDDVDLWTAGISERPLQGAMIGPTFACIIGLQFRNLRKGDRFWHENGGWLSSFSLDQLQEIRKIKLSRIICDNSDDIETIQVYALVLPDNDINPRISCNSQILPSIDVTKWRDLSLVTSSGK